MTSNPGITEKQLRLLLILFREAGIDDRDQRLAITSNFVGRHVNSSSNLTITEASDLIDELKKALEGAVTK